MTATQFLFDWPGQRRFSELSGDYNPMHLDAVAARRLMFGGAVVHGVHLLLRGLESFACARKINLTMQSIHAQFCHPVAVGAMVDFEIDERGEKETLINARIGKSIAAKIAVAWASDIHSSLGVGHDAPAREPCVILNEEDMSAAKGQVPLTLPSKLMTELFPVLCDHVQPHQVATLLATTRIVGMKCPGHHSIFSELDLSFAPNDKTSGALEFAVGNFDSRFRLATLNVKGACVEGVLKTFLRLPAQNQATVAELSRFVKPDEFADRRALIIGGSRGLGELCAKLLAAGSADVQLTYRSGEADAATVIEDIASNGAAATAHRFDVADGSRALLERLGDFQPTDMLYFATPQIFRPRTEEFSKALFDEFTNVYVNSFSEIVLKLLENGALESVLQPSTVAIDELTRDLPEYIAAKSAAEGLCLYLQKTYPKIVFQMPRLPRLPTDQTVNLSGIDGDDPVPLMLKILAKGS